MPTNLNVLAPHRGGKTKMTTGTGASKVLENGELFVEYPDTGVGTGKSKIKIGDGVTAYSSLPYALGETSTDLITFSESTATTVTQALNEAVSGASLATIIAGLKKAIQLGGGGGGGVSIFTGTLAEWEALTDEEKAQYDLISNDEPGGLQDMFPSSLVGYGANSNVEAELNKLNDDIGELIKIATKKGSFTPATPIPQYLSIEDKIFDDVIGYTIIGIFVASGSPSTVLFGAVSEYNIINGSNHNKLYVSYASRVTSTTDYKVTIVRIKNDVIAS